MIGNDDKGINRTVLVDLSLTRKYQDAITIQKVEERNRATSERTHRFNLLSLLPLTTTDGATTGPGSTASQRVLIDFRVDIEASGWLAFYHYANRSSNIHNVLPHIRDRLSTCNVDFRYLMRDSKFSALNAAEEFYDAYSSSTVASSDKNNTMYPEGSLLDDLQEIIDKTTAEQRNAITRPHAVIGASRSAASSAVGYMTTAFLIPQISSISTANYLNNQDVYPIFSRTVPTNQGDAQAMASYLQYLNTTHVGILYINDGYGNDFHSDLVTYLYASDIVVFSQPYDDMSVEESIDQLMESKQKHIIAILNPSTWRNVLSLAIQYEIIGQPDYFWIFGESSLQFAVASFQLDQESESDLARALHGSAVLAITEQVHEPFDAALSHFSDNIALQQRYIGDHVEPEIFKNHSFPNAERSIYQYTTYDAVVAMMLAVCEASIDGDYYNTSGSQIYEQLIRTEFEGVSGYVSFDLATGTRNSSQILYGVQNIKFPNEFNTNGTYKVLSTLTYVINLTDSASPVEPLAMMYFASNTTVPPPSLSPAIVDMNLIPTSIRAFCLSLSGFVIIMSMWWMFWTYVNREKDVVKASQPIFLCQICIGTMIIASAIIPMSIQEPVNSNGLNISCMATPWLLSVGFVTTFSALFTKTWRLNKLFENSRKLRRVVIRPRHVVLPFIILLVLNTAIMLTWTLEAPFVWDRKFLDSFDEFGRSVESVGRCVPSDTQHSTIYLSLIVAINFLALLCAIYQAYIARNLPSEFSESTYITVAIGSLLEVCVLGIPLLFLASSDPSINFLIRSILAAVTSLSALLPIFLPKYFQRNVNRRYNAAVVATTGAAPIQSRVKISMGSDTNASASVGQSNNDTDTTSSRSQVLAPGLTAIRRNPDYYKEHQAAVMQKTSSINIFTMLKRNSSRTRSSAELNQKDAFCSEDQSSTKMKSSLSQTLVGD